LIFFVIRLFSGAASRLPAGGAMPRSVARRRAPRPQQYRGHDTTVGDADLNAFQSIHSAVQEAWGGPISAGLRQAMTPENAELFLRGTDPHTARGVQNIVSDVSLFEGEISESWDRGRPAIRHRLSAVERDDYVARLGRSPGDPHYLVSGDPKTPSESEEVWTFVRRSGGNWLLSAIQQV